MANEDQQTVANGGDADQAGGGSAKSAGLSMGKLIAFGGIAVVAIVIGVVVALMVVGPMMSSSDSAGQPASEETRQTDPDHAKAKSKKDGNHESVVYDIRDIVINPAGTGGTRFLSASFAFELNSEAAAKEFEAKEPLIRDALITILSSKTIAQLTDVKQKEIVRYQIKKRIADILKTDELAGVFYTDFVLQ